jgi:biopolymer transport protein ExbB/TolQ
MKDVVQILVVAFMALVVLMQWLVMMRISRVERMLRSLAAAQAEESVSKAPEREYSQQKSHGQGLFEQFLAEDPERQRLTKREASEAFRDWRKQQGMTWQSTETEEGAEA